jgi:hypothetical protein
MDVVNATAPHARDDPPWGDCGDPRNPAFGSVFAWVAADRAVALTYDRCGRRHALTLFERDRLGPEVVIQGRRFTVQPGQAAEARL